MSLFSSKLDSALNKHKVQNLEEFDSKLPFHEQLTSSNKSHFKFKFNSNEKQVELNSERRLEITKAILCIKEGKYEKATDFLEECAQAIGERNKIVQAWLGYDGGVCG